MPKRSLFHWNCERVLKSQSKIWIWNEVDTLYVAGYSRLEIFRTEKWSFLWSDNQAEFTRRGHVSTDKQKNFIGKNISGLVIGYIEVSNELYHVTSSSKPVNILRCSVLNCKVLK